MKSRNFPLINIISHFQIVQIAQQDSVNQIVPLSQFPQIPRSTINMISELISEEKSILECLDSIKSSFPYNISMLEKNNFSDIHIYYIFIAWIVCNDTKNAIETFPIFIKKIKSNQSLIPNNNYIYIINTVIQQFIDLGGKLTIDLVKIVFNELSPKFFDLIIIIIDQAIQNNDYEIYQFLVEKIILELKNNHSEYESLNFSKILSCMYQYSCNLDAVALNFISIISSYFIIEDLFQFFGDLLIFISTKIQQFSPKLDRNPEPVESEISKYDTYQNFVIQIQIEAPDSFPKGFLLLKATEFESQITYDTFFDSSEIEIFDKITCLFDNCLPIYTERFFDVYSKFVSLAAEKNFWGDFYCSFQYFLSKVKKVNLNQNISESLLQFVFKPGISSFNKCDHFDIIRFFRINALSIIAQHQPTMLCELLNRYERNPFLFADIIGCIHARLSIFEGDVLTDESSLSSIIYAISILDSFQNELRQKLNEDVDNNPLYTTVQQARSTIFIFLFALIDNNSTKFRCFSSSSLTTGFLSRVFEPSLQEPIISSIKQFLLNFESSQVSQTIQFIGGLIDVCRRNKKHEKLALELLSCVNDSISHNPKIADVCDTMLEPITLYVTERPSSDFLSQTLQLYLQLSLNNNDFQLNLSQAQLLSRAIKQQCIDDENTMLRLIGIMARSRSATEKSMFFIRMPMLVLLFFSIIENEEKCHKYLKMFNDLCHHTIYNCIQCHKGEFDLFLLQIIKNYNQKFTFRGFEFNFVVSESDIKEIIIPLLNYIECYISSPQFLHKLIETLIDFSKYSFDLMNSFSQTSSVFTNQPRIALMSGFYDNYALINDVRSEDIQNGFTIQMTVQIDTFYSQTSSSLPLLFSITDATHGFYAYIQGSSLVAQISYQVGDKEKLSSAALVSSFPPCIWKTFTIILHPVENQPSKITFAFDDTKEETFTANYMPFSSGPLNIQIGGLRRKGPSADSYIAIACFRMFPGVLYRNQIKELPPIHQPRSYHSNDETGNQTFIPLFSYPSIHPSYYKNIQFRQRQNNNDHQQLQQAIQLQQQQQQNEFLVPRSISFPKLKLHFYSSFLDVCSSEDCFKSLIPFFCYINEMPDHFPEVFLDFLHSLIVYNGNPKFANLFSLVGHILIKYCDPEKLNYQVYLKFFGLLDNCSELTIINSIISNLLFNPELWISCKAKQLSRIVSHWCTTLYSAYPNQIPQFSEILTIVRIYFWNEPIEIEYIRGTKDSDRPRPSDLNIDIIKSNFAKILLQIAQSSFDSRSAKALISHCTTCPDSKSVIWMMSLFVEIAKATHAEINVPQELCEMLYTQLKPRQEERFVATLKVVYILSGNFLYHLRIIMTLLNSFFYTDLLFEKLLDELNEYPLLFPLCILVSINVEKTNLMAEKLNSVDIQNPRILLNNQFWSFFPLILANYIDDDKMVYLINFILNIICKEFQFGYLDSIIMIADILESTNLLHINKFFKSFLAELINKVDVSFFEKIFYRCMKFTFLHLDTDSKRTKLNQEFLKSPFYQKEQKIDIDSTRKPTFKPIERYSSSDSDNVKKARRKLGVASSSQSFLNFKKPTALSPMRSQSNMSRISYNIFNNNELSFNSKGFVKIQTMNDLITILKQPNESDDYRFMILIDDDFNYVDFNFFDPIIKKFLSLKLSETEHLKNMKKIINYFLERKEKFKNKKEIEFLFFKEIMIIQPLIEEFIQIFGKKRFKQMINLKSFLIQSIEDNCSKAFRSLGKIDSKEVAIAAIDIDVYHSHCEMSKNQNEKEMKRMKKQEMTPISPFYERNKDSTFNILKRDLIYSTNFIQSRFKNVKEFKFHKFNSKPFFQKSPETVFSCFCTNVVIGEEIPSVFEIRKDSISILNEKKRQFLKSESIIKILQRNRFNRNSSIEIFTTKGYSLLLDFHPLTNQQIIQSLIKNIPNIFVQILSFSDHFNTTKFTESWVNGYLSNFKYLIHLNIYSGRSFNDENLYPIMPWIVNNISDYKSSKRISMSRSSSNLNSKSHSDSNLNLYSNSLSESDSFLKSASSSNELNTSTIRDLSKSIAEIAGCEKKNACSIPPLVNEAVSFYLARIEPFTSLFNQNKEKNDFEFVRPFASLQKTWNIAKKNSIGFELTPEFFYAPEYFDDFRKQETQKINENEIKDINQKDSNKNSNQIEDQNISENNNEDENVKENNESSNQNDTDGINENSSNDQKDINENINNKSESINEINETDINNENGIIRNTRRRGDKIPRVASANNLFKNDLASSSSHTFFSQDDSSMSEEFVYKHRRILESPEVSSTLNLWIDLIWGIGRKTNKSSSTELTEDSYSNSNSIKNDQFPSQIFTKSHPQKNFTSEFKYKKQLDFSVQQGIDIDKYGTPLLTVVLPFNHLFIVTSRSQIHQFFASFENPSDSTLICTDSINFNVESSLIENDDFVKFIPIVNGLIIHNSHIVSIYREDTYISTSTKDAINLTFSLGTIKRVLFNNDIVACVNENCQIQMWDILQVIRDNRKAKDPFTVTIMDDTVSSFSAIAMSRNYKEIVYGTPDGLIRAISLDGGYIFSQKIEENPLKILITESEGFILVLTNSFIYLLSSNGKRIRRSKKKVDFVYWTTFSSFSGFDFIAAADSKGQIFLFEAFFLDIHHPIFNCRTNVVSLSYSNIDKNLFIVSEDNHIFIIPTNLPYVPL